jgi:predicted transcriptional regulator
MKRQNINQACKFNNYVFLNKILYRLFNIIEKVKDILSKAINCGKSNLIYQFTNYYILVKYKEKKFINEIKKKELGDGR